MNAAVRCAVCCGQFWWCRRTFWGACGPTGVADCCNVTWARRHVGTWMTAAERLNLQSKMVVVVVLVVVTVCVCACMHAYMFNLCLIQNTGWESMPDGTLLCRLDTHIDTYTQPHIQSHIYKATLTPTYQNAVAHIKTCTRTRGHTPGRV